MDIFRCFLVPLCAINTVSSSYVCYGARYGAFGYHSYVCIPVVESLGLDKEQDKWAVVPVGPGLAFSLRDLGKWNPSLTPHLSTTV